MLPLMRWRRSIIAVVPVRGASGLDGEGLQTAAAGGLGLALTNARLPGMQPGGGPFGLSGRMKDGTLVVLEDREP